MSTETPSTSLTIDERIHGCILGGACGDALGAPVEFLSAGEIAAAFGPEGINGFVEAYGVRGAITDDPQMTLFTIEGIIRAYARFAGRGLCHIPSVVHHAYLRWLTTQDTPFPSSSGPLPHDGWLIGERRLWARRAPGNTCLSALRANSRFGHLAENDSKGCGTVMRSAPFGFLAYRDGEIDRVFDIAFDSARLTHGHPTAAVASGALAVIIAHLVAGKSLEEAIRNALSRIEEHPDGRETADAIDKALSLSRDADWRHRLPELGDGWIAEEALAIALLCALATEDAAEAIIAAANHGGDSDSTASIAGNLVGTLNGPSALLTAWTCKIELRDVIDTLSADFANVVRTDFDAEANGDRYPGW